MDLLIYAIIGLFAVLFFGLGLARDLIGKPGAQNQASSKAKIDPNQEAKLPYQACKSLLTPNEHAFFKVLQPLVEPHWHLFAKVRMEDIIEVPKEVEHREKQSLRGRIKSRHIDFVICDPTTLAVVTCIELDDKSHQKKKSKEADQYNDRAMRDAGVLLIRVPARMTYNEEYIKRYLFEEETSNEAPAPTQVSA
ncbi:DUF2726 domain-containing protein [Coraliomargarita sp. SDUM461003]|uniref:DUF2726 domain-containing protein n=1 Tax=Thalassobacterium maritimum TaxID=3041265 RepID=A0ABU1AYS3_9BACT|nr:DUF2726 domain-containing protein [Coraliomargarita sp. SDUM461003]MDQ8209310.1 DUF2726 domain-containing protein [Coraliomargarita sp. SDUM461003]